MARVIAGNEPHFCPLGVGGYRRVELARYCQTKLPVQASRIRVATRSAEREERQAATAVSRQGDATRELRASIVQHN